MPDEKKAPTREIGRQETIGTDGAPKPEISPAPGTTKPEMPTTTQKCNQSRQEEKHWLDYLEAAMGGIGLVVLVAYTIYTALMYHANKEAAYAAKSAATTAASQLELTERPWVNAVITPDGPFDFNVNGANIHLKFQLRNSGHSPALMTVIEAEPVDSVFTGIGDPVQYRDRACRAADATIQKYPTRGVAVFPNNSVDTSWTYTFSTEELNKNHGKDSRMPGVLVWPSVVVCIGYRPPFSKTIYHTSYIFLLRRVDASNRLLADFKIGEDVPQDQLRLILSDESPISAD